MARVVLTPQAREDLTDIWFRVAQHDQVAADRLVDAIERACLRLARNPESGPARPDLAPGVRYIPLGRYLLFYRIVPGGVDVIRVVHGARFLPGLI